MHELLVLYETWILMEDSVKLSPKEKAVFEIVRDINDRSGLEDAWEDMDRDTREEILETWVSLVEEAFS